MSEVVDRVSRMESIQKLKNDVCKGCGSSIDLNANRELISREERIWNYKQCQYKPSLFSIRATIDHSHILLYDAQYSTHEPYQIAASAATAAPPTRAVFFAYFTSKR